jgi:hypothetical protein
VIQNFLRPPQTVAEIAADGVRVLGVVSVVVAVVWFTLLDAGVVAFALPALMIPRFLALRAGYDIAIGVSVLVAAWSNVFGLYRSVPGWDLVVHGVASAAIALMVLVLLDELDVLRNPAESRHPLVAGLVLGGGLALALGSLWEMVEWFGRNVITDDIYVTYNDTIADLAADGIGGLAAGAAVALTRVTRRDRAPVSAKR